MRRSFSIFQAGFFLILQIAFPANILPQSFIEKPLHICRSFKSEILQGTQTASDNVNVLYVPLPDGSIKGVSSKSFEIFWQAELGGEIKDILVDDSANLLAATIVSKTADDNKTSELSLNIQLLSSKTGIAQWKQELAINSKTERIFMLFNQKNNNLYVLSDKGNFFVLNRKDGQTENEKNLNKEVNFPVLTPDDKIYFGSGENEIYAVSLATDKLVLSEVAKLNGQPTSLILDQKENIFAGDNLGFVYEIQAKNTNVKWKSRTGGQITSVKEYTDKLLVSSSDNYIYMLSKSNGDRIWKKRLEGKMQGDPPIENDFAIVSPIGSNTATVVDLKKGKTVNKVSVGAGENTLTINPFIIGKNVIFTTLEGFSSYSSEDCMTEK